MKKLHRQTSDFVIGLHCLEELLKHSPERIIKVMALKNAEFGGRKEKLIASLHQNDIPITWVQKDVFYSYCRSDTHQGFITFIKQRVYLELHDFLNNLSEKTVVLALDSIYDPQNFGALLRAADCFGVKAVLWSKNRGSDITPTVAKASSGASEIVPLLRVSNLATTLLTFKKKGFAIFAAEADPKAQNIYEASFPNHVVLVMGSEGEGVQPLIRKMCDQLLYIPMEGKISSLNVSQAAAVCLGQLYCAHSRKSFLFH